MTPSRIAYVINVFPKLSETFIASELAELRRRGVDLRIISLRIPTESIRHQFIAQAELDRLTCYKPTEFIPFLQAFQPELIHAHFATEPTAAARDLSAQLGIPFTFTAHGYDIRRKPPLDFAERAVAARAVITVSEANAQHIVAAFDVPRSHLHVIPCGVDTTKFRPIEREAVFSSPPLLVCVARHVKVKNLGLLLRACALLRDRALDFRCVLVGDGPCSSELEEQAAELQLQDVVQFVGAADHDEVRRWWQKADMALLSSENEGMPVSLMEAAACGVPAVAPAVGGIPELVLDGVTGLLSTPNDIESLSRAIQRLIDDPDLRARMGRAARLRAEECLSLERQVDQLLKLWRQIIG
jgi:colanic acid/amylovoran biosynthesis glycosyltransferase